MAQISASVGEGRTAFGGNRQGDVAIIWNALTSIAPALGGKQGSAAGGLAQLAAAIYDFQRRWPGELQVDGWISPNGGTLRKINALLGGSSGVSAAAPVAAAGGAKLYALTAEHMMFQGNQDWAKIRLNTGRDPTKTIHAKGCLLTSIACGLAYQGIRIPLEVASAIPSVIASKRDPGLGPFLGSYTKMTPATLDAWMTMKNGQGYANPASYDIDAGKVGLVVGLPFMGCHTPDRSDWLAIPTAKKMAEFFASRAMLIVRRTENQNHYLWVTGDNGDGTFRVWDVGYGAGNEHHTATVSVDELDRVYRWKPR